MKRLMLLAALLLAGCAGRETVVHIPVPCRAPAIERPAMDHFDHLPATAAIDDQVLALLDDRTAAAGYIWQLEAAVAACR